MVVANVPFPSLCVIQYLGQSAIFSPLLQLALCTNAMAVFTRMKKLKKKTISKNCKQ